jgi:FkbM family methyltransferase
MGSGMTAIRFLRTIRDNSSILRRLHRLSREPYYRALEALYPNGVEVVMPGNCRVRLAPRLLGVSPESYEASVAGLIDEHVQEGMTVLDIGAHVGLHALRMSRRVGETGRVVVVEPSPANAAMLRNHIRWNKCRNVVVVEAAVGEAPGKIAFTYRADATDPGGFANSIAYDIGGETISVDMTTIDLLCDDIEPDFIKIDIEGAELLALRGARKTLEATHPMLIVAIHPEAMRALGASPDETIELMRRMRYRGRRLDGSLVSTPGFEEIIFRLDGGVN